MPWNAAELLTLQSRRIILKRSLDMKGVAGYELLGGDYIEPRDAFSEKMTIWRRVSKENEKRVYMPQQHDPSRQLWREFPAILNKESHKPGVLNWNLQLQNKGILSRKEQIVFQIVGVRYDEQEASVKDCYTDQLSVQLELLNVLGRRWTERIEREVQNCMEAAEKIGQLDKGLKLAGGLDPSRFKAFKDAQKMTEAARAQFYFAVDQPFRRWLQSIDPETDEPVEKAAEWQEQAYRLAAELGRQMVEQAGTAAFIGHRVPDKKNPEKSYLYTAPKAYNSFLYDLRKLYPKQDEGGTE